MCLSATNIKPLRELSTWLKRGNTIMIFVSVFSFIRSALYPALFTAYQKEKCTWYEVSKYTVNLVHDLSFPNISIQYDSIHFCKHT